MCVSGSGVEGHKPYLENLGIARHPLAPPPPSLPPSLHNNIQQANTQQKLPYFTPQTYATINVQTVDRRLDNDIIPINIPGEPPLDTAVEVTDRPETLGHPSYKLPLRVYMQSNDSIRVTMYNEYEVAVLQYKSQAMQLKLAAACRGSHLQRKSVFQNSTD